MFQRIILILIFGFLLTGCTKPSTIINVNLPVSDIKTSEDVVILDNTNTNTNSNINIDNTNKPTENLNTNQSMTPVKVEVPAKLELDVDFSPQAPFGNWNELNEEACEEASMIIVAKYFSNLPLDEKIMENELIKVDIWEKANNYKIDLSVNEVSAVLKQYFKISSKVEDDVSVDRIKYELSLGNLIIVPAAGRELQNPYFKAPGPIYHMLVIKGYTNSEFITNEVGTKRGDGFKYKYQTLINAIHDWNPNWSHYDVTDEQIGAQPQKMIIISK